jgi:cell division protein FtsW
MAKLSTYFKGDSVLIALVIIMGLASFLPVYSAAANLEYVVGVDRTTMGFLVRHAIMLTMGIGFFIILLPRVNYRILVDLSILILPIMIILLVITLMQGSEIGGANASRWIRLPFVGLTLQTSTAANIFLIIYVSRYLWKNSAKGFDWRHSLYFLWLPVFMVLALVVPANLSTGLLIALGIFILIMIGEYPFKFSLRIFIAGALMFLMFILTVKAFPSLMSNRVETWSSRIEKFIGGEEDKREGLQVEKAKVAIATGGVFGLGSGKSVQRNFLPQSSSDFIYAIIIEEYGLIGGVFFMFCYIIMAFRFLIIAKNSKELLGKFLVIGLGTPIIIQALVNMAVASNLMPVTGQTLPFVSSGGTSILMTCFSIGIILSVSVANKKAAEKMALENLNVEPVNQDYETSYS